MKLLLQFDINLIGFWHKLNQFWVDQTQFQPNSGFGTHFRKFCGSGQKLWFTFGDCITSLYSTTVQTPSTGTCAISIKYSVAALTRSTLLKKKNIVFLNVDYICVFRSVHCKQRHHEPNTIFGHYFVIHSHDKGPK